MRRNWRKKRAKNKKNKKIEKRLPGVGRKIRGTPPAIYVFSSLKNP